MTTAQTRNHSSPETSLVGIHQPVVINTGRVKQNVPSDKI